jgi:hypothetical protein
MCARQNRGAPRNGAGRRADGRGSRPKESRRKKKRLPIIKVVVTILINGPVSWQRPYGVYTFIH